MSEKHSTCAQVREKPILFSGPMIRAILEGRKSQTRRIVKNPPANARVCHGGSALTFCDYAGSPWPERGMSFCPYGAPGDRLWVRETWMPLWDSGAGFDTCLRPSRCEDKPDTIKYRADGEKPKNFAAKWRPSIFMPRWASRITLEITEVRVQGVQEMSGDDILAEGAVLRPHHNEYLGKCPISAFDNACYPDLKSLWAAGWNSINGKGSWESNPFVWCISFRRIN